MDFCKFIKIGPFYLYLSTRRLKGRGKHDDLLRNKRKKLLRLKNRIYKMNGGLCECCGRPFFCEEMEVHHIVPVSENPRLITAFSNLQVVCPECHAKIHGRPVGGGNSLRGQTPQREH